jgi:intracellular septation protein A
MSSIAIIAGIIPLFVFVIVDMFAKVRTALAVAVVFAVIEAIASYVMFGSLDQITLFSFLMVLAMAAISFSKEDSIFFKFQPVIFSFFLGSYLIISFIVQDVPILLALMTKYSSHFPTDFQTKLADPFVRNLVSVYPLYLGIGLLLHALATAWAALKLSNWWWIAMRAIGFYAFSFLAAIAANVHIAAIS